MVAAEAAGYKGSEQSLYRLILRVDRADLSKNVLRGFTAFDLFLEQHPEFKEQVTFIAHLIEVADPAEETFPYAGRTEFTDPETGEKLTAGRAEQLGDDYRRLYLARRQELGAWCRRLGWSYTVNHTDRLASEALVRVHMAMSDEGALGVQG